LDALGNEHHINPFPFDPARRRRMATNRFLHDLRNVDALGSECQAIRIASDLKVGGFDCIKDVPIIAAMIARKLEDLFVDELVQQTSIREINNALPPKSRISQHHHLNPKQLYKPRAP